MELNVASNKGKMAGQLISKRKELNMDIEAILLDNQKKDAGSEHTPRKVGGILSYIKTNVSKGVNGRDPGTADGNAVRTDGTKRLFTEDLLQETLEKIYMSSGFDNYTLMMHPSLMKLFSEFKGNATKYREGNGISKNENTYASNYGVVTVLPNRHMRERDALILNPSLIKVLTLRNEVNDVAHVKDSTDKQILHEYTLQILNEKGLGLITDLKDK